MTNHTHITVWVLWLNVKHRSTRVYMCLNPFVTEMLLEPKYHDQKWENSFLCGARVDISLLTQVINFVHVTLSKTTRYDDPRWWSVLPKYKHYNATLHSNTVLCRWPPFYTFSYSKHCVIYRYGFICGKTCQFVPCDATWHESIVFGCNITFTECEFLLKGAITTILYLRVWVSSMTIKWL